MISVLVADDHEDVRVSLVQLLEQSPDLHVVAACTDGDEVLPEAERTHPDVALLDLSMPRRDGLAAARDLHRALPQVRVVILTGSVDPAAVQEAYKLGAVGYLLKSEDPDALAGFIVAVAAGGTAWDPAAGRVLELARHGSSG